MTSSTSSRSSSEQGEEYQAWPLPDVTSDKVLASAEKEAQEEIQRAAQEQESEASSESIDLAEEPLAAIRADELAAITEAAEKEGYEAGYQQGETEGKEAGLQAGYEEGLAKGQQKIIEQCEQLQHIIDALLIPLESEQKQIESVLLTMVSRLTEAVVLRELKLDSSHIACLVDEAIKSLPLGTEKFSLFINPQDLELIRTHLDKQHHHSDQEILIQEDEQLMPGGCRLEAKHTSVDYTVEQRLQTVLDGFLHKRFVDTESHAEALAADDDTSEVKAVETQQQQKDEQSKDEQSDGSSDAGESK